VNKSQSNHSLCGDGAQWIPKGCYTQLVTWSARAIFVMALTELPQSVQIVR
jgi:hypothetical protein